jgi:hypothetical protein
MKAYTGSRGKAPLILELDGNGWSTSCLGHFTLGRSPCSHWIGGCVGPQSLSLNNWCILCCNSKLNTILHNYCYVFYTTGLEIPSEVETCCQIKDTTLVVLTAVTLSFCAANSEKFWKAVSKCSPKTWHKHYGVVNSFAFEIILVLIMAETHWSVVWQPQGLDDQVLISCRGTGIFLFVTMPKLALWPIPHPSIGAVFLSVG